MNLNGKENFHEPPQITSINQYPHINNTLQQPQPQQHTLQWTNYQPQIQRSQSQSQSHLPPQLQHIPQPLNGTILFNNQTPNWNLAQNYSQYIPRPQPYGYPPTSQYQPVHIDQINMTNHRKTYVTPQNLTPHQQQFENFSRAPLPPYAIATINNSTSKRSRPINEANPNTPKRSFRNTRRRHKNSHLGCATCKSRRIKCDEQLPECHNCLRARLSCAYLALDDNAREALKVAQQAHAARIQSLNLQANVQKSKNMYFYPYKAEGLPTKILTHPVTEHPESLIRPLQINLQKPFFPEPNEQSILQQQQQQSSSSSSSSSQLILSPIPQLQQHQLSSSSLPKTQIPQNPHTQLLQQSSPHSLPIINTNVSPLPESSSDVMKALTTESSESSSVTPEPRFSIEQDSYMALAALIKEHRDVPRQNLDDLSKLDGEYVEITLDPNCTKHLNKYWVPYDKDKEELYASGFEKEVLYDEYDDYYELLMKEATNNIVLFKSLLSNGASLLSQSSEREEVKKHAKNQLNRDFEITLRFLNKFRIKFTQNITNLPDFFENVSLCFSKFQIFQTSLAITFYGSHSMKDNVELTNRFFEFIIEYLKEEFNVFLDDEIFAKYKDDEHFERASLFNDYIHIFVIYFSQCIKSYNTRIYSTVFFEEILNKFKGLKPEIYDNLNDKFKKHYDDLHDYMVLLNNYFKEIREKGTSTNRLQVIFYSLKKFLSILPSEIHTYSVPPDYETKVIVAYYHAVSSSLNAIFPETRFYFVYSFNGRDGIKASSAILTSLREEKSNYTERQNITFSYPTKIIQFFKKRTLILSELLKDASTFPARIMLDEQNKKILAKLIQEDQIESFEAEIKESSYPHIDQSSNFINKESNSIVIPSVSATKSFTNFPVEQTKRFENLKTSVETELTELDKNLFSSLLLKRQYNDVETEEKKKKKEQPKSINDERL